MKELYAFRDKDLEGDIWSEKAFLFLKKETIEKFFNPDNTDLQKMYCDENTYDPIMDFEVTHSPSGDITQVSFKTIYAGKVVIEEMQRGYLIESK